MFFSATSQPITFQRHRARNPLYIIDLQEVIGSREAGLPITHLLLTNHKTWYMQPAWHIKKQIIA